MMCPHMLGREDSKLCHLGEAVTTVLNVQEKRRSTTEEKIPLYAYRTKGKKNSSIQSDPYSLSHGTGISRKDDKDNVYGLFLGKHKIFT